MREIGVDISAQRSRDLGAFAGEAMDLAVTVCDVAAGTCPMVPWAKRTVHASFPDPAAATGSERERLAAFRAVRDGIATWIDVAFGDAGDDRTGRDRGRG
jgi:arsenate reductase